MSVIIKHATVASDPQVPRLGATEWNEEHTIDGLDKAAVGLEDVDNTSDLNKPLSTATISALADKVDIADFDEDVDARITIQKGAANGLAPLESDGKISTLYMPYAVLGATIYQGTWDASTNTPEITAGAGTKGHYYVVNVDGSTDIDGIDDWKMGDWIIFNGSVWEKVDNTDAVISVNGMIGPVVITASTIGLGNVNNTSDANKPISTATQTALDAKANKALTINTQTDDYTLILTDANSTLIEMNKATSVNLTVPPNSSVAFPTGTQIPISQIGAGQVTVVAGSGVTIRTSETLKAKKQYAMLSLYKRGTDEWLLTGERESA